MKDDTVHTSLERKGGEMMNYILCSDGFSKFVETISDCENGLDALEERIGMALEYIQEELHLGKAAMVMEVRPNMYQSRGRSITHDFFNYERGYSSDSVEIDYMTGNKSIFHLYFYPEIGYKWSEDEKASVRNLSNIIYMAMRRARLKELVEKAMMTDSMTMVSNTSGMKQFLEKIIAVNNLALYNCAFMNIKNFRYYNQKVGSAQGDELLRKYASKIDDFLLPDENVTRMGGDNFIVFVKKERIGTFFELMKKINIQLWIDNQPMSLDVETRMGIYDIAPGNNIDDALNCATIAFSYARQQNANNVVWFEKKMRDKDLQAQDVSVAFPKALKNGELIVYYQPKVALKDNSLCGTEALVRWVRNGVIVPPMEFIPALEREGTICELDMYVFEAVCKDIRRWLDHGMNPVRVSVNFSKLHFKDDNFADRILEIIHRQGIPSNYIEIELTEASGFESFDNFVEFSKIMRNNGIEVSIDDFGTGYSSLNVLKKLDVDIIKLDKSFIDTIENEDLQDEVFIRNIVNMINELGMRVVAEGVETDAQVKFLKKIDCSAVQGYYYDRPMPRERFEERLLEKRVY